MPCNSEGYEPRSEPKNSGKNIEELAAILCGIFTAYGFDVERLVDWKEVGVTRNEALDWWERHQEADKIRLAYEEAKKAREEFKKICSR